MKITVKYFASLRETMNRDEDCIEGGNIRYVQDVWDQVVGDKADSIPGQVLCAVNCRHADYNTAVTDGDEVAFFPPVTGG